jgi:hypothetical protein
MLPTGTKTNLYFRTIYPPDDALTQRIFTSRDERRPRRILDGVIPFLGIVAWLTAIAENLGLPQLVVTFERAESFLSGRIHVPVELRFSLERWELGIVALVDGKLWAGNVQKIGGSCRKR